MDRYTKFDHLTDDELLVMAATNTDSMDDLALALAIRLKHVVDERDALRHATEDDSLRFMQQANLAGCLL